ncbi:MAG TPA: cache domain-containing protein [Allosphingosinicella sp.]|nr:cache domain-containing protein [Allosphingosinicella sp.]
MRFRRSAPRALIVVAALVIAVLTFAANRLFGGMTSAVEQSQVELMRSIIAFNLEGAAANALARAEMTASDPLVRELLARQDRAGLLAHTQAMFNEQRDKYGVDQAQFHLAPATSFLRLQSPALFGDDLSRFRPIVVAVNRERVARKGVALARTGPGVFGVAPIRDMAGNHVGSVEFGMDFGALLDRLKAAYGLELTLFIDEAPLRAYANGMPPGAITEQNRLGTTVRLHSTNWTLMRDLVNADDLRVHDEPRDWVRDAGGVPYGVVLYPLRSGSGEVLGAIAVARSFAPTRGAAGRTDVLQWLFALLGFLVLAGAAVIVIRGWLVRPLEAITGRFATIGDGERPEPDPDDRFLAEEMKALAAEHERLAELVEAKRT